MTPLIAEVESKRTGSSRQALAGAIAEPIAPSAPTHESILQEADTKLSAGATADALSLYDAVIARAADRHEGHSGRGLCLARLGRPDDAVTAFRAAVALQPTAAQFRNLGVALSELGRHAEAAQAFADALAADPSYAAVRPLLSVSLLQLDRSDQAIEVIRDWVRANPDDPAAYEALGHALERAGRIDESLPWWEQAARLTPDPSPRLWVEIARAQIQLGRTDAADVSLDSALEVDPTFVNAHLLAAVSAWRTGGRSKALLHFEQGLRLHRLRPTFWDPPYGRDVALMNLHWEANAPERCVFSTPIELPKAVPSLTLLVGCYGDFPQYSVRCLESIASGVDRPRQARVLVGLNACGPETRDLARRMADEGAIDGLIESHANLNKDPMMRLLLEQASTPYVAWMDDDSHFVDRRWPALLHGWLASEHPFDVGGQPARWGPRRDQDADYMAFLRRRPWFRTDQHWTDELRGWVPFCLGGFFLARTAFLRRHNFPDPQMIKLLDDVALGDLVQQQGGRLVSASTDVLAAVRISDGQRRGENFDRFCTESGRPSSNARDAEACSRAAKDAVVNKH